MWCYVYEHILHLIIFITVADVKKTLTILRNSYKQAIRLLKKQKPNS